MDITIDKDTWLVVENLHNFAYMFSFSNEELDQFRGYTYPALVVANPSKGLRVFDKNMFEDWFIFISQQRALEYHVIWNAEMFIAIGEEVKEGMENQFPFLFLRFSPSIKLVMPLNDFITMANQVGDNIRQVMEVTNNGE